jgi:hypothetical protein
MHGVTIAIVMVIYPMSAHTERTNECWNVTKRCTISQIITNQSRPWQQNRIDGGPTTNFNPKKNFNRRQVFFFL